MRVQTETWSCGCRTIKFLSKKGHILEAMRAYCKDARHCKLLLEMPTATEYFGYSERKVKKLVNA